MVCWSRPGPATTGYRRYSPDQIATAGRIALLRRAGIGLAGIKQFLTAPAAAVIDQWLTDLAAETDLRRRALVALASALGFSATQPEETAVAVIIRPVDSATELASAFDVAGAQFDPVIDHSDQRRGRRDGLHVPAAGSDAQNPRRDGWPAPARHGRALLRAFEASAQRLGAARISLGAGAETGFYIRHGYQTMLLLQWVYDPGRFDSDVAALAAGPAKGMTWRRDSSAVCPSCSWISTNRARSCASRFRTWSAART